MVRKGSDVGMIWTLPRCGKPASFNEPGGTTEMRAFCSSLSLDRQFSVEGSGTGTGRGKGRPSLHTLSGESTGNIKP